MMTTYRERREGGVWEKGGRKKEREEQKNKFDLFISDSRSEDMEPAKAQHKKRQVEVNSRPDKLHDFRAYFSAC